MLTTLETSCVTKLEVKTDEIFLIQSKLIENSREHRALKFIDPCNGLTYYCIQIATF